MPTNPTDLIAWLHGKLIAAEGTLKTREEMACVWRHGTNAEWKAASPTGRAMSKAARLKEAETHDRIAIKLRREVDMFRAALAALGHGQPSSPVTEKYTALGEGRQITAY